ncbi:hypothetical protein QWY16_11510 [Planococcus shenhongbingii]|uniref:hypothetical protein n=1 Tax=Planococcus shenhongbingii TaxID=3058398 RepID=UPI00262428CF|nr:hypothetical protein [Planococcus sp. N016]WKA57128.1 hypothetical protein QWY16_11510 [Planococcus sp. N016]
MIEAYQKLWPNRTDVGTISSLEQLEQKILIELNDELTHPRVRKTKQEKLDIALTRIEQSLLTEEEKTALSMLYKKIAAP